MACPNEGAKGGTGPEPYVVDTVRGGSYTAPASSHVENAMVRGWFSQPRCRLIPIGGEPAHMTLFRTPPTRVAAGAVIAVALTLSMACSSITVRKEMHEANALYKAEKYEDAVGHYKKVVAADPKYIEAWLNMGYAYRALFHPGSTHEKDVEYARAGIEAFRKVIEIDPKNEKAQQYFLDFCTVAERYDEAITYFENELKSNPNDAQLIRQIASLYG